MNHRTDTQLNQKEDISGVIRDYCNYLQMNLKLAMNSQDLDTMIGAMKETRTALKNLSGFFEEQTKGTVEMTWEVSQEELASMERLSGLWRKELAKHCEEIKGQDFQNQE